MNHQALDRVLDELPGSQPAPGGAVAVIHEGRLLAQRSWGWADVERRLPFTPDTLFRVCSITKQFTCGTMLSQFQDPAALDAAVRALLPNLVPKAPSAALLAHNQSGLRDYWATAMLCGAPVERAFGDGETAAMLARNHTLQFAPGTRYSYCNQNFRILGDALQDLTGRSLDAQMRAQIFEQAGMATARLVPDTSAMPDGTVGYEGSVETGFRPAINRIHWTGDAGLAASLRDMIAWECFIDATSDDADGLYRRLSAPVSFQDGAPAFYGFGLSRMTICGRAATGHGGGLRGWRSFRCHIPSERLSAVVLYNHMGDPRAAIQRVVAALLDHPADPAPLVPDSGWNGDYEEPQTGLAVRLQTTPDQKVQLTYSGQRPEPLDLTEAGTLAGGGTVLRRQDQSIWMDRSIDNQSSCLISAAGTGKRDLVGRFHNAELDATLTCVASETALYGAFSGFLGQGLMGGLIAAGPDLWRLPMPRALDDSPPGDWTLKVLRNDQGAIAGVQVGCWLARGLVFTPV